MRHNTVGHHVLSFLSSFRRVKTITARFLHGRTLSKRRSLYDVLDVSHSATQAEIKAAYYADVNNSEEAQHMFTELTKAYSVLSNLNLRREYDKEIGAYFTMRSVKKKEAGEKILRLTDEMLEIDMNGTRESGIFLSTIATLSTVMGVPVRLTNVSVPNGGLQSHDMRVLQLLRMICNVTLAANTGLSTVTYIPGELLSGHFSAEAGRLGYVAISTCLIPYISLQN